MNFGKSTITQWELEISSLRLRNASGEAEHARVCVSLRRDVQITH